MMWLIFVVMSQSHGLGTAPTGLPKGLDCRPDQKECCLIKLSVESCKAAAISEGKKPEMSAEESESILGTGANSMSVMNCIAHDKNAGYWKSAKDHCQKQLDSCVKGCGEAYNGSWSPEHCKNAIDPIMALIDGAKSDADGGAEQSRESLKALTGGDDAEVESIITDAKQKLATGEKQKPDAGAPAQITPVATSTEPVTSPTAPTPSVTAEPTRGTGTESSGGGSVALPRPPVATTPVQATPVRLPTPGSGQVVAFPTPSAGLPLPSTGVNPVVIRPPGGGAQVGVNPGNSLPNPTPLPSQNTPSGGSATVVLTPASVMYSASYNSARAPGAVGERQPSSATPIAVASAPTIDNGEVEPQTKKSLFGIVSGGYSSWSTRSPLSLSDFADR